MAFSRRDGELDRLRDALGGKLHVSLGVAEENPRLYYEIQRLNDFGTESLSALLLAIERLRSVVRAGDEQGFVRLMEEGRESLERWRD